LTQREREKERQRASTSRGNDRERKRDREQAQAGGMTGRRRSRLPAEQGAGCGTPSQDPGILA